MSHRPDPTDRPTTNHHTINQPTNHTTTDQPKRNEVGLGMSSMFHRAVKYDAKLRMALAGPAGAGKTYTALTIATALAGGRPVAVVDTERGSASKYADLFGFDVLELTSYHPDRYSEAIRAAVEEGYAVVVVDSLSHGWEGEDGLLAQVNRVAKLRHNGNTFNAWGDAEIRRMEQHFIGALTGLPIHVIATMRTKSDYVVETNERGKAAPRKVGLAPRQRDGLEYEFDIFGQMSLDNELAIQKTRCPALAGQVIPKPGKGLADTLSAWLSGAPAPAPAPTRPSTPAADSRPSQAHKTQEPVSAPVHKATAPTPTPTPAPATKPATQSGAKQQRTSAAQEAAGVAYMAVADFIKEAQTRYGLNPKQVMERLGVKSLTGLNLAQALDILGKTSEEPQFNAPGTAAATAADTADDEPEITFTVEEPGDEGAIDYDLATLGVGHGRGN